MESKGRMSKGDILLAVFITFLWALCFPLISAGISKSPPLLFAGLRSLVAGVSLSLPAFILGCRLPRTLKDWIFLTGIGLSYTTMGFAGMFLAGGLVTPGIATVLSNIQPLIAAILAYLFLIERLKGHIKIGLLIGFLGIFLIAMPGFFLNGTNSNPKGVIFVLIGALGVAIGNVLLKKLAGHIDKFIVTGLQFIFGGAVLFILSYLLEPHNSVQWGVPFISVLLVLGILGTALSLLLWFMLLRRTELTRLNTFTFLTPVFGLIIGAVFFGERLSLIEGAGILFIVGATYWVSREKTLIFPKSAR